MEMNIAIKEDENQLFKIDDFGKIKTRRIPTNSRFQEFNQITDQKLFDLGVEAVFVKVRYNEKKDAQTHNTYTIPRSVTGAQKDFEISHKSHRIDDVTAVIIPVERGCIDPLVKWYKNTFPKDIFDNLHVLILGVCPIGRPEILRYERQKTASGPGSGGVKGLKLASIDKEKDFFKFDQTQLDDLACDFGREYCEDIWEVGLKHRKSTCKIKPYKKYS